MDGNGLLGSAFLGCSFHLKTIFECALHELLAWKELMLITLFFACLSL